MQQKKAYMHVSVEILHIFDNTTYENRKETISDVQKINEKDRKDAKRAGFWCRADAWTGLDLEFQHSPRICDISIRRHGSALHSLAYKHKAV